MTEKEIAELADVSIGTVDRVIYKRGRVAAATRARIERIIEQYQFKPNPVARRLKRNRAYRFCALLPRREQDAGYWGQALAGIEEAARETAPLGVETEIFEYDRYDPAEFRDMADMLLAKEPDGVILPPIMPEKTRGLIGTAAERGIPYVFFDTDLPDEKPLCAIVQDPFRGGYLAGRLMHLFASNPLAGSNTLAVLDAHEDDYNITRRRDGFLRYAEEHGFPVFVRDYSDYRGTEISVDEIADFLDGASGLTGIFITNCMAHRVAEAVERRMNVERQMNAERQVNAERREGGSRCLIVGYDLIPKNRELLREGRIDAIISQRPEEQGRQALLNLYRSVVLEQPILPKIEIPLDVYIKENVPLG